MKDIHAKVEDALSDYPVGHTPPLPYKKPVIGYIGLCTVIVSIVLTISGFFYDSTAMRKVIVAAFLLSSINMYGWLLFNARQIWRNFLRGFLL